MPHATAAATWHARARWRGMRGPGSWCLFTLPPCWCTALGRGGRGACVRAAGPVRGRPLLPHSTHNAPAPVFPHAPASGAQHPLARGRRRLLLSSFLPRSQPSFLPPSIASYPPSLPAPPRSRLVTSCHDPERLPDRQPPCSSSPLSSVRRPPLFFLLLVSPSRLTTTRARAPAEFFVFASMALMILANMGQLTQNMVARNMYIANLDLRHATAASSPVFSPSAFSSNLSEPLLEHQGLRREYYWGLYSVCGGDGTTGTRKCSPRSFGHQFDPLAVVVADTANVTAIPGQVISSPNSSGKLQDQHWLHVFSRVGFYFLFVGTILTGALFLAGAAAEGVFFLLAAGFALLTGAVLCVGAGMWTAVVSESRKTVHQGSGAQLGIEIHFGNLLWMIWAAAGATLAATFPFLLAFFLARRERKLYDDRVYTYSQEPRDVTPSASKEYETPARY